MSIWGKSKGGKKNGLWQLFKSKHEFKKSGMRYVKGGFEVGPKGAIVRRPYSPGVNQEIPEVIREAGIRVIYQWGPIRDGRREDVWIDPNAPGLYSSIAYKVAKMDNPKWREAYLKGLLGLPPNFKWV